jgi:AcrR family transcriptional regulator
MRALAELSLERGYATVTVDEIAERADLGRATFYTHFRDKADLLSHVVEDIRADLADRMAALTAAERSGFTGKPLETLFVHAQAEPQIYQLILRGTGDGDALREMLHEISGVAEQEWTKRVRAAGVSPRLPLAVAARAWAGQTTSLLLWWLDNEMPYPAPEMARMGRDIAVHGHEWAQGF